MGNRVKNSNVNDSGFTLVEVVASIAIISIILLGVVQLMTFTNKTATSNNTKLVTTHLAKATIERIKIKPKTYFSFDDVGPNEKEYTIENCKPNECEDLYQFLINNQQYNVSVKINQNNEEKELDLINVVVEVKHDKGNSKSIVEGYVIDEPSKE